MERSVNHCEFQTDLGFDDARLIDQGVIASVGSTVSSGDAGMDGCLKKLLTNTRVVKFLAQHHADIGEEFRKLIEAPDLNISNGQ